MANVLVRQHILAARQNWETVRVSSNLPEEIVRELERRGKDAPFVQQSSDFDPVENLPWVRRGFPLSNGDWAFSSFRDIGKSLTRERGNYLVHTVVVPAQTVKEHRYNMPWIGIQLARLVADEWLRMIPSEIYDLHEKGHTAIEDVEVDLDPMGQFRILPFIAQEMGIQPLMEVLQRLLGQICTGSIIDLPLPAPNPESVADAVDLCSAGPDTEGRIPGDRLRALRLAGIYSILPTGHKTTLAYAVNQPKALTPARRGETPDYALRVPREALSAQNSGARQNTTQGVELQPWSWLKNCIALAASTPETEDRCHAELLAELDWISELLPAMFPLSSATMAAGFRFWDAYAGWPSQSRPPEIPFHIFDGMKVNLDLLIDYTRGPAVARDWEKRLEYALQFSAMAEKAGMDCPQAVMADLLSVFNDVCLSGDENYLRAFFERLPRGMQPQILQKVNELGSTIGGVNRIKNPSTLRLLAKFFVASFDPAQIPTPEAVFKTKVEIRDLLFRGWTTWIPPASARGFQNSAPNAVERMAWVIQGLCTLDEAHPEIVQYLTDEFVQALYLPPYGDSAAGESRDVDFPSVNAIPIGDLIRKATTHLRLGKVGYDVLPLLLDKLRRRSDLDVYHALLSLRLEPNMLLPLSALLNETIRRLVAYDPGPVSALAAAKLVLEFAQALQYPESLESFGPGSTVLPVVRAWIDDRSRPVSTTRKVIQMVVAGFPLGGSTRGGSYCLFPPETTIAVVSTYLRCLPCLEVETRSLFYLLERILDHDTKLIRRWIEERPIRGMFLYRSLLVACSYTSNAGMDWWNKIERVLCRTSPEFQDEVRRHMMASANFRHLPSDVRRKIESPWRGPQGGAWESEDRRGGSNWQA